ncbi:MAG: hypothetical protein GF320_18820 [Armatimonadia bacterium]|nr:hypothetical protein [Armatimonadia bacterium]
MPAIIALLLCTLAPLEPQLYDDLGDPDRSPHLITGSPYTFGEATVDAQESARTVAFDPQAVVLRYEELDASAEYALRVTYATERDGPRTQRLTCEGVELHGPRELPRGSSEVLDLPVPGSAVQDRVLELSFERVAGPNAVVSEVWLLSDESIKERHLAAHGDLRGNLTALVLDGLPPHRCTDDYLTAL